MNRLRNHKEIIVYTMIELICTIGFFVSIFLPWMKENYTQEFNGESLFFYIKKYLWISFYKYPNIVSGNNVEEHIFFEEALWEIAAIVIFFCAVIMIVLIAKRITLLCDKDYNILNIYRKGNAFQFMIIIIICICATIVFIHPGEFQYYKSVSGYYGFGLGWYLIWISTVLLFLTEVSDLIYKNVMKEKE